MGSMSSEDGPGRLRTEYKLEVVPTTVFGTCIDRNSAGIYGPSEKGGQYLV